MLRVHRWQVLVLRRERTVQLPGNPLVDGLSEGKPTNQAQALLHCASELVMVNDVCIVRLEPRSLVSLVSD